MSLRTRRHDAYDDIEITDPRVMRALAHPVRLAALSHLQGHGPATATQLAPIVGASPSVTSWHLRHLAQHGLVSDWEGGTDGRQRWWKAAARGIRLMQPPDDASGADAAYRALSSQLIAQAMGQVRDWQRQVEPALDTDWRAVAGISNTTVLATPSEIAEILDAVERLLAPYVRRRDRRAARGEERFVRMVRLTLPGAAPDGPA
jgi:DNA-binding transcriptional ArsR family regulator